VVDCTGGITCDPTKEEKDTKINLAPSERALQVLLDSAILSLVALSTTDILAQIIFDTGASLAISPHRSDFDDNPTPLSRPTQMGGMRKDLQIEGITTVVWIFNAKDGSEVQLRARAYYVPGAKARILSPQNLSTINEVFLVIFVKTKKKSLLILVTAQTLKSIIAQNPGY
jgi:hypothetical protein